MLEEKREKANKKSREWYAKNSEKAKAHTKIWRLKNPEMVKKINRIGFKYQKIALNIFFHKQKDEPYLME